MNKIFTAAFLLFSLYGFAQQKILIKRVDDHGVVKHMVFDNTKSFISIEKATQLLHDTLNLSKEDELVLIKETKDELGFTRKTYEQRFKGIKIEDGLYGVHGRNGKVEYISGEYKKVKNVAIIPTISEKEALEKTLGYIKATKYRWQIPSEETDIKRYKKDTTATFYPKGELLICKDVIKTDSIYRLAYKFDIFAVEPLSHKIYYIDAITGDLLDARNLIFDTNTPATGTSLYRGPVQITTDSDNGGYRLYETRSANNVQIETFNSGNTWTMPSTDFTNATTTWSSNAAIDAHWGAEKVFDYWFSPPRNLNSIDGRGMAIHGYVHYGQSYDNANWDGYEMLYGDGGSLFKPVVSLDIVAHETGHGIMQYTAAFNSNRENPSLNEGFSDIWGAVIEHSIVPDNTNNWLIGEKIMNDGTYLRSLRDPKSKLMPDTYHGTYWIDPSGCAVPDPLSNDQCYCHTNLSVLSHWFYLLSQGGSNTNDIHNYYNVYGLGIDTAARIVWQAENVNLRGHPNAQYSDVMTQTIQAVEDIYGTNSFAEMQVKNAWYAVGLGTKPLQMSITGSMKVCTSGAVYIVNNLPLGCSVSWDGSPNLSLSSASDSIATFTANSSGSEAGWVRATIISSSGQDTLPRRAVWVGVPSIPTDISGFSRNGTEFIGDYNYNFIVRHPNNQDVNQFKWTVSGGTIEAGQGTNMITVKTWPNTGTGKIYFNLDVRVGNDCGFSLPLARSGYIMPGIGPLDGPVYMVYPNPTSSDVTVSISDTKSTQNVASEPKTKYIKTIRVYDKYGSMLKIKNFGDKTSSTTINVSDLQTGSYILEISNAGGKESHPLIKK